MTGLRLGCGLNGLRSMGPGSVDTVISDLPSGETDAAFDVALDLSELFDACWRALKPDGVLVFMAHSLRFAAQLAALEGFRYEWVWEKSLATGFLLAASRPLRAHEYVLVFCREASTFNPQRSAGHPPSHPVARRGGHGANYGARFRPESYRDGGSTERHPRSVLRFPSLGTSAVARIHPQQKPVSLLRYLVETYSGVGDLVVDPFAGSATTGCAAMETARRFVGWELDPDLHQAASARLAQVQPGLPLPVGVCA